MPAWLSGEPGRWRVELHVQPGASRTTPRGEHDGRLKLSVAAPPVDGRANDAVVDWFAKRLGVPRSNLRIAAGTSSRRKTLAVDAPIAADRFAALVD
jgi:uncharacterized protein (TIGR00251 family)